ncbi:MAG: hypothetical protein N3D20_02305, partial [Candidatus Pacearchaeota archaeon]|nr:hypothetical protein [Candidatus Pacearchaeota archaeon]
SCSFNDINQTQQICSANQQCSGGNCYNITCYANSDCGTDGLIGSAFCIGNNVSKVFRSFTCNNPGTINSSCSFNDINQTQQICSANQQCSGGNCITTCVNECSFSGAKACTYIEACSGIECFKNYHYSICGNYDGDVCLELGGDYSCGRKNICSNGCVQENCNDECLIVGEKQKVGTKCKFCGNWDSDSCWEWSTTLYSCDAKFL